MRSYFIYITSELVYNAIDSAIDFWQNLWHYVFEVISMKDNEKTCHDCKHYRRHYVKMGRRFREIHDGHCVYPRVKRRRAEDMACPHFKQREPEAGCEISSLGL